MPLLPLGPVLGPFVLQSSPILPVPQYNPCTHALAPVTAPHICAQPQGLCPAPTSQRAGPFTTLAPAPPDCTVPQRRRHFSTAVSGQHIYAIGGWYLDSLLAPDVSTALYAAVERYDPWHDTWAFVSSLPLTDITFAISLSHDVPLCTAQADCLYALGSVRRTGEKLLLRYDVQAGEQEAPACPAQCPTTPQLASGPGLSPGQRVPALQVLLSLPPWRLLPTPGSCSLGHWGSDLQGDAQAMLSQGWLARGSGPRAGRLDTVRLGLAGGHCRMPRQGTCPSPAPHPLLQTRGRSCCRR